MDTKKLLKLSRQIITNQLDSTESIDTSILNDKTLQHKQATFVTLKQNGQLRGCIGSIIPHRSFVDDLVYNSKAAAFEDPRFLPLSKEELANTQIEISILTEPKEIVYSNIEDLKTKITPFEDGVILKLGSRQATFLPQVWEEIPEFDIFFSHLGMKAGISNNPLIQHPQIWIYQVKHFQE